MTSPPLPAGLPVSSASRQGARQELVFTQMTFAVPPRRRSILIVEDEVMIAMMLEEFLETLGHHVHAIASSVQEASEKVREGGFDLAILDCHLGGEEIWPVATMLDEAGIPFIFCSGGSKADLPEAFANRPLLGKPYTIGSISDVLSGDLPHVA